MLRDGMGWDGVPAAQCPTASCSLGLRCGASLPTAAQMCGPTLPVGCVFWGRAIWDPLPQPCLAMPKSCPHPERTSELSWAPRAQGPQGRDPREGTPGHGDPKGIGMPGQRDPRAGTPGCRDPGLGMQLQTQQVPQ